MEAITMPAAVVYDLLMRASAETILEHIGEVGAGELAALVGVEDLGLVTSTG
jgi:hypothetical protein